jgi:serine/threonine-protein kinase
MSVSADAASNKAFVNVSTQFCLDSNGNGHVYTLGCNGGNHQNWTVSGQRLINVSTGKCLSAAPLHIVGLLSICSVHYLETR